MIFDAVDILLEHGPKAILFSKAPCRAWLEAQKRCVHPIVFEAFFRSVEEEENKKGPKELRRMLRQCWELTLLVRKCARSADYARDFTTAGGKRIVIVTGEEEIPTLAAGVEDFYFLADCRNRLQCTVPVRAKHVYIEHAKTIAFERYERMAQGIYDDDDDDDIYSESTVNDEDDEEEEQEEQEEEQEDEEQEEYVGDEEEEEEEQTMDRMESVWLPKVTRIGSDSLMECKYMTKAVLPNVVRIGSGAFAQCYSLRDLFCPLVGLIEGWAFHECGNLMEVVLPTADIIEDHAFSECHALEKVYLPQYARYSQLAFDCCYRVTVRHC